MKSLFFLICVNTYVLQKPTNIPDVYVNEAVCVLAEFNLGNSLPLLNSNHSSCILSHSYDNIDSLEIVESVPLTS